MRAVVLDGPDSWVQLLEPQGIIEKFVPIDFSDAETVFDRCVSPNDRRFIPFRWCIAAV